MTHRFTAGLLALALGACSAQTPPADNGAAAAEPTGDPSVSPDMETVPPSETALLTDGWVGKWTGVEGLALDIDAGSAPGKYAIEVTLMDGAARYEGTGDGDTIRFVREGRPETIRAVAGGETGLKWLAEKTDCLMIKPGEGFCRD